MKNIRLISCCVLILTLCQLANAQNGGRIAGNLETNGNFFLKDSLIGAANTPQYEDQLFGAEAWLNLSYSNWGFDFGLRFDLYNNSNLRIPTGSYTAQGIGRWFIKKKIHKLDISAGYLYDQIGGGIIFRAYEERSLFIDNSLFGVRLAYDLAPDWQIKVFTGQQKQQLESNRSVVDTYDPIIKGLSLEGFITGDSTSNWSLAPGFGVVNRTLDRPTMRSITDFVSVSQPKDSFILNHNTYAFSAFNTLTVGTFSWYLEGAVKTGEGMIRPLQDTLGNVIGERFFKGNGSVVYTSLSYAKSGFGITLEGKRTENFSFRTQPVRKIKFWLD